MFSLRTMVKVSIATVALTSMPAFAAGNPGNSQALAAGLRQAKAVVDNAIAGAQGAGGLSGGSTGGSTGSAPGGGNGPGGPWGMTVEDVNENDAIALPVLIQASTSLGQAATDSDLANFAFISGNIAFGNFKFALACSQMGISRSQISRANTAALQFPLGFLSAFGPDLTQVLIELNQLKFTEGCP